LENPVELALHVINAWAQLAYASKPMNAIHAIEIFWFELIG
jgi:hypothetical protein